MSELGPVRPDRLTIWPVERAGTHEFGIDVRWGGPPGAGRAATARDHLLGAGVEAKLRQDIDGSGWSVRIGPVAPQHVASTIDAFVW